ncbi:MAG: hypothetical protein ACTSPB_00660 [Candidatus Thorarchaeota archaeon]
MRVSNGLLIWLMTRYRSKTQRLRSKDKTEQLRLTNALMVLGVACILGLYIASFEVSIWFYTMSFRSFSVPFFLMFLMIAWRYQRLTTLFGFTTMSGEYEARAKFINSMVYLLEKLGKKVFYFEIEDYLMDSSRDVLVHKTDAHRLLYLCCMVVASIDWFLNPLWGFHDVESDIIFIDSEENLEKVRNFSMKKLSKVVWY